MASWTIEVRPTTFTNSGCSRMSVPVIIPTYGRHEQIGPKSLHFLSTAGVVADRIHLIVANDAEAQLYRQTLDSKTYGHLHTASVGLASARKWAALHFPQNTPLLFMDDDISGLVQKRKSGELSAVRDLDAIIKRGFDECHASGLKLWGIYPVYNTMFMRRFLRTGRLYVVGLFYGVINDQDFSPCNEELEDFERCAHHCTKNGGVVRFDDLAAKTKYWAKGGMSAPGRPERVAASREACTALLERYPHVFSCVRQKRNGIANPAFKTSGNQKQELP